MIDKKNKKINQNKYSFAVIFSLNFCSWKVQDNFFIFLNHLKNNIFYMKIHRKKDKILILILINFYFKSKIYRDKSGIKNTLLKKYLFFYLFLIDFYI